MSGSAAGLGQPPTVQTESQFQVTNVLGMASTLTSISLLGATAFLIFKRERPPQWFLWLVAGKLGLDLVQAGWVMSMARKEAIKPQSQPKEM